MPNGTQTPPPSPTMRSLDPPTFSNIALIEPPPPDYYEVTGRARPGRMGAVTVQPVPREYPPLPRGGERPGDPSFDRYAGSAAAGGCIGAITGPLLCSAAVYPLCASLSPLFLPAGAALGLIGGVIVTLSGVKVLNCVAKACWDHRYGPHNGN